MSLMKILNCIKRSSRMAALLIMASAVIVSTSCSDNEKVGGENETTIPTGENIKIKFFELSDNTENEGEKLYTVSTEVMNGRSKTLYIEITKDGNEFIDYESINWQSTTPGIIEAVPSEDKKSCVVTAKDRKGLSHLNVMVVANNRTYSSGCIVNATIVPVESVEIQKTDGFFDNNGNKTINLGKGTTYQFIAKILPGDATNKDIKWTSSSNQLKIDKNGKVTVGKQNVEDIIITAQSVANSVYTDQCYVNIIDVYPESIKVFNAVTDEEYTDGQEVEMGVGETFKLRIGYNPENSTVVPKLRTEAIEGSKNEFIIKGTDITSTKPNDKCKLIIEVPKDLNNNIITFALQLNVDEGTNMEGNHDGLENEADDIDGSKKPE